MFLLSFHLTLNAVYFTLFFTRSVLMAVLIEFTERQSKRINRHRHRDLLFLGGTHATMSSAGQTLPQVKARIIIMAITVHSYC